MEWTRYLERADRVENFDGRIAYTPVDGHGVIKDLIEWTSN